MLYVYRKWFMNYAAYFKDWKEWDTFEEPFSGEIGVYAFRLKFEFPRLQSVSSVIYIGKSANKSGIFYRLMNYRQHNKGGSSRLKEIEKAFGGKSAIQYSYVFCENPRDIEKELLADYMKAHLELPPLNRSN